MVREKINDDLVKETCIVNIEYKDDASESVKAIITTTSLYQYIVNVNVNGDFYCSVRAPRMYHESLIAQDKISEYIWLKIKDQIIADELNLD